MSIQGVLRGVKGVFRGVKEVKELSLPSVADGYCLMVVV